MADEATEGQGSRVIILGGGPAGVATAFWLTAPEQRHRYQVTLYTPGWRLGGKCASGRNAEKNNRIEEHGLHLLMGCYQNAFATIRTCYDAWKPASDQPFPSWQQAFLPQRQVTLMERDDPASPARWTPWNFADLPQFPGNPGDGPTLVDHLVAAGQPDASPARRNRPFINQMIDWLEEHIHTPRHIHDEFSAAVQTLRRAVTATSTVDRRGDGTHEALPELASANHAVRSVLQAADDLTRPDLDIATGIFGQHAVILANLGLSIGYGYVRDILFRGADAYDLLNTRDFRDWLKDCGASDETLNSAIIKALYDLTFAFQNGASGSLDNGSIAAGVALRFLLEMTCGYRNAPFWKMAAGMGEVVFVPFYEVLRQRGVDIQFFHRATEVRPGIDGRIGEIDILQQAKTVGGALYDPLVKVDTLGCWPNQPDWAQLCGGAALKADGVNFESSDCTVSVGKRTLGVGKDFDIVVLAMPPEALKPVVRPLTATNAQWEQALAASRSVATQALQLWMLPNLPGLGWMLEPTVLTSFAEPYDSWADMSHLLSCETWAGSDAPRSIAYFCGCLSERSGSPDDWLTQNISALWPDAATPGKPMKPGLEVCRYGRTNTDLSELYVQTPAGKNVASRFTSAETAGFSNLYVVGDWTRTRFSGGCFESAIESGMLASRAISGLPVAVET